MPKPKPKPKPKVTVKPKPKPNPNPNPTPTPKPDPSLSPNPNPNQDALALCQPRQRCEPDAHEECARVERCTYCSLLTQCVTYTTPAAAFRYYDVRPPEPEP